MRVLVQVLGGLNYPPEVLRNQKVKEGFLFDASAVGTRKEYFALRTVLRFTGDLLLLFIIIESQIVVYFVELASAGLIALDN